MEDVNSSTASDYNIHLSHLPCGMYFLKVTDGELNITEKFIVK
ncbi:MULTISPECIES: T9SS type A sorting domain-containing protein [unclassified Bacteroides]|nr:MULTISPECIES: T9SS type A sorting domain-containing protein [unclassified Bacteroides]RGN51248.1 T9SS C-terminal target domain-containing protein [Bacteroides sp. OM05-12]RHR78638.1 T9SS C-terminal target domain-containing protein [Bacteroides sp. AF16-49]